VSKRLHDHQRTRRLVSQHTCVHIYVTMVYHHDRSVTRHISRYIIYMYPLLLLLLLLYYCGYTSVHLRCCQSVMVYLAMVARGCYVYSCKINTTATNTALPITNPLLLLLVSLLVISLLAMLLSTLIDVA
jgi:hypothetical protein